MNFKTFEPPENLKTFIKYFWALESNGAEHTEKTFSAIVDGCPGVIMLQSEKEGFCDEENKKLPNIFLYGQTIKPVKFSTTGNVDALGICFQPHALKSVFGIDADELTNACLDLNNLSNKKQGKLSERLLNAPSMDDQVKILSFYLVDKIQSNNTKDDALIRHAVNQILRTSGNVSLPDLQSQLKLSERSLERKFRQTVGISPKLFSRICRFQQSLNQMRQSKYDKLSDIAYANEYSDQSHFIRVFREFTGFSPLEFQKQANEVVENFPVIK